LQFHQYHQKEQLPPIKRTTYLPQKEQLPPTERTTTSHKKNNYLPQKEQQKEQLPPTKRTTYFPQKEQLPPTKRTTTSHKKNNLPPTKRTTTSHKKTTTYIDGSAILVWKILALLKQIVTVRSILSEYSYFNCNESFTAKNGIHMLWYLMESFLFILCGIDKGEN